MSQPKTNNPLLCDFEMGACPTTGEKETGKLDAQATKIIKIVYYTDPICSSCWGIEPQLRKLKMDYGHVLDISYKMGGLLPDWSYNSGGISEPKHVAAHWDEASKYYGMPIDGDVWLEDPLDSSYPPSIAFKAAEMQDKKKAVVFLRKLREGLFLQKKNITKWEHVETAATFADLDIKKLKHDFNGPANKLFQADLDLGKKLRVRGFPTMFFINANEQQEMVYGAKPYESYENAILKLYPTVQKQSSDPGIEDILSLYPSWTIRELAVVANLSESEAKTIMDKQVMAKKMTRYTSKNGPIYRVLKQ